jgi:hypothetical protein
MHKNLSWLTPSISFAIGSLISLACALLALIAVKQSVPGFSGSN